MNKSHDVITFFQRIFILRRPGVAIFAEIIKILTTLLNQSLKTQEKLEELEIMYLNGLCIYISWYSKICWFMVKKMLLSAELKECITWFIYFLGLFPLRYNCAKFHYCRICATDFKERGPFFALPNRKKPEKAHPE